VARKSVLDEAELLRVRYQLPTIFTAGAPVVDARFLAGRNDQINRALATVAQAGQHAVIYGERGVGKTSLAGLIHLIWSEYIRDTDTVSARVQCNSADTYGKVWQRIAERLQWDMKQRQMTPAGNGLFAECAELIEAQAADPALITKFLSLIGRKAIIVIDEFDTIGDDFAPMLMASTIKELSDFVVDATIFLVGVADSVDELVEQHASTERCLVQIFMPRMSTNELMDIVTSRLTRVGMNINERDSLRIAALSQGFPYYAHLLGFHAANEAVTGRRALSVQATDINVAITEAIAKSQQSILSDYVTAITSPRPENLYRQTLLGCALTQTDDLGYFAPADVKDPLTRIMARSRDVPDFIKQLRALSSEERGPALDQVGENRKLRYRFHNALLKPYVVFRGVKEGLITEQDAYLYAQPEIAQQLALFDR